MKTDLEKMRLEDEGRLVEHTGKGTKSGLSLLRLNKECLHGADVRRPSSELLEDKPLENAIELQDLREPGVLAPEGEEMGDEPSDDCRRSE